ncbi:MAG TPA: acyltransferase [Acidimicrobiales bacterium]|nr:acyltransferase [Acidimicrobiales bacterium]
MNRLQHVRALDGVRGVAVVLIVVHHIVVRAADPPFSGWAGVDLFFALSGFLITQSILTSGGAGGIGLGEFYRRRFWRLAPALALFLAIAVVVWPEDPNPKSALAAATQWLNALQGYGEPPFSPHLAHLWSISAEVQFYVVWALVLFALVRLRVPRVLVLALLVGAFAGSQALRVAIVGDGAFVWNRPYFAPDTRSAALAAGCIVGLAFAWGWLDGRFARWTLAVATVPAVTALWWGTTFHHLDERLYTVAMPLAALGGAGLVAAAAVRAPSPVRLLCELQPLPFLGKISYSLYLWHLPLFEQVAEWRGADDLAGIATIGVPMALAAATASHYLVERPLLRGVRGLRARRAERVPQVA